MNDQNEYNVEQQENSLIKQTAKNVGKEAGKQVATKIAKEVAKKVLLKKLLLVALIVIAILVIIIIVVAVIAAVYASLFSATKDLTKMKDGEGNIINSISIIEEDGNYSYKISDAVKKQIINNIEKTGVSLGSFNMNEDLIQKMIEAEIKTSLPKIGEDGFQGAVRIMRYDYRGNQILGVDKDNNSTNELTYITPTKFLEKYNEAKALEAEGNSASWAKEANKNSNSILATEADRLAEEDYYNASLEMTQTEKDIENKLQQYYQYFTLGKITTDENGQTVIEEDLDNILIIKFNKEIKINIASRTNYTHTTKDGTTSYNVRYIKYGRNVNYSVEATSYSYRNLVIQYAMPFEFLFALQQTSLNPKWIEALANVVLNESEIDLKLFENLDISDTEKKDDFGWWTDNTSADDLIIDRVITNNNNISSTIAKVKTWIYNKNILYSLQTQGTDPIEEQYEIHDSRKVGKGSKKESNTKIGWDEIAEENIPSDAGQTGEWIDVNPFLRLWKNATGKAEIEKDDAGNIINGTFEKNGILVKYSVPGQIEKASPAKSIEVSADVLLNLLLPSNQKTQKYEDILRYLLFKYTGKSYGITDEDLQKLLDFFKPGSFGYGIGTGGFSLTTPVLTKEQFKSALQDYYNNNRNTSFKNNFLDHADEIYDLSLKYSVNPELVITKALGESGFSQPASGNYNYWGVATPNGQTAATYFGSLEAGIKAFAAVVNDDMPGGKNAAWITERARQRESANGNPNGYGMPGTLQGFLSVYSHLCGSNRKHREGNSGDGGNYYLKVIYGSEFNAKCGNIHKIGVDEYTIQEESDYTAWQYQQQIDAWNTFFGNYGSIGGDFLQVAQNVWQKLCNQMKTYDSANSKSVPPKGNSTDCSHFISWVLYEYGYEEFKGVQKSTKTIMNKADEWSKKYGWKVIDVAAGQDPSDLLQPGDIFVRNGNEVNHAYIYVGPNQSYDSGNSSNWLNKNGSPCNFADMLTGSRANAPGKIIRVTPPK